jgi:hypothetical protein
MDTLLVNRNWRLIGLTEQLLLLEDEQFLQQQLLLDLVVIGWVSGIDIVRED